MGTPSLFFLLALATISSVQAITRDCPADPFTDPSTDTCNPLRYIPSLVPNIAAALLYGTASALLFYQWLRNGGKWFLVLPIGVGLEAAGLAIRIYFRKHPDSLNVYVAMNMLVVLSPCAFLAANYILLGRIVIFLRASECLLISPQIVSKIFIWSDVITFLVQAGGGGISSSGSANTAKIGAWIFFVGLLLQLLSYTLFTLLAIHFYFKVKTSGYLRSTSSYLHHSGWQHLYYALFWSCVFYIVRSIYRVVELSQGYSGYLATHEVYFLCLDSLPLFLGLIVYCWFWPTKYLGERDGQTKPTEYPFNTNQNYPPSYQMHNHTRRVSGSPLLSQ